MVRTFQCTWTCKKKIVVIMHSDFDFEISNLSLYFRVVLCLPDKWTEINGRGLRKGTRLLLWKT